ncbi:hypothetical protein ACVWZ6_000633 [Bradyrhizobium sp. GM6.1]
MLLKSCATPPGELADRLHFLGLADALVGRDLVGQVAVERIEENAFASLERRDAELGPELLTVASPHQKFAPWISQRLLLGFEKELQSGPDAFALTGGDEKLNRILADRLLTGPSEELLGLRVPTQDGPGVVRLGESIERGLDDVARKLFALPQGLLCKPRFCHVAPDKEVALGVVGPAAEPGQPDLTTVLVEAAGVRELQPLAAPERAHLVARLVEMAGMNEIGAAAADHLLRPVAENGLAARTDLRDVAARVHHHDQILGGLEDLSPFLELLLQRPLGPSRLGQAARGAGGAHDLARWAPDRRQAE